MKKILVASLLVLFFMGLGVTKPKKIKMKIVNEFTIYSAQGKRLYNHKYAIVCIDNIKYFLNYKNDSLSPKYNTKGKIETCN